MATVTLRIPDEFLAEIDAEAGNNRTKFILDAAKAAIVALKRKRLDEEVGRILVADADENIAIDQEFSHTLRDGLE
jgi:metal-responsive CopG/Arc/MetJ family transcriptional regulator